MESKELVIEFSGSIPVRVTIQIPDIYPKSVVDAVRKRLTKEIGECVCFILNNRPKKQENLGLDER